MFNFCQILFFRSRFLKCKGQSHFFFQCPKLLKIILRMREVSYDFLLIRIQIVTFLKSSSIKKLPAGIGRLDSFLPSGKITVPEYKEYNTIGSFNIYIYLLPIRSKLFFLFDKNHNRKTHNIIQTNWPTMSK